MRVHLGSRIRRIDPLNSKNEYYICAVPFDRIDKLVPELGLGDQLAAFENSPIAGIHLWFDRPITSLPHAMLVDGLVQWVFDKGGGYYLGVVSAARELLALHSSEIVSATLAQLRQTFPGAREARLERSQVVKETRATYSCKPGLESLRPGASTALPNVFLAGDWTATGWPATMEGAVRSGYRAAEALLEAAEHSRRTAGR